eukprot:5069661-Amphidinium_carterae.2
MAEIPRSTKQKVSATREIPLHFWKTQWILSKLEALRKAPHNVCQELIVHQKLLMGMLQGLPVVLCCLPSAIACLRKYCLMTDKSLWNSTWQPPNMSPKHCHMAYIWYLHDIGTV